MARQVNCGRTADGGPEGSSYAAKQCPESGCPRSEYSTAVRAACPLPLSHCCTADEAPDTAAKAAPPTIAEAGRPPRADQKRKLGKSPLKARLHADARPALHPLEGPVEERLHPPPSQPRRKPSMPTGISRLSLRLGAGGSGNGLGPAVQADPDDSLQHHLAAAEGRPVGPCQRGSSQPEQVIMLYATVSGTTEVATRPPSYMGALRARAGIAITKHEGAGTVHLWSPEGAWEPRAGWVAFPLPRLCSQVLMSLERRMILKISDQACHCWISHV